MFLCFHFILLLFIESMWPCVYGKALDAFNRLNRLCDINESCFRTSATIWAIIVFFLPSASALHFSLFAATKFLQHEIENVTLLCSFFLLYIVLDGCACWTCKLLTSVNGNMHRMAFLCRPLFMWRRQNLQSKTLQIISHFPVKVRMSQVTRMMMWYVWEERGACKWKCSIYTCKIVCYVLLSVWRENRKKRQNKS